MIETKGSNVTAITVTYNRTVTLKKCIKALLNQTIKPKNIIIVDNNSREDEKQEILLIAEESSQIHVVFLDENIGGAGGFETGMRTAIEKYPADWYWIMDDDAYPRNDCLEQLLSAANKAGLENIGFVAPLIYGIDYRDYQYYHHKFLKGAALSDTPIAESYEDYNNINKVEANAFVGPLISKSAIESVGIADGSLFIYGDDTEYTYRITRRFSGYMVKSAVIDHQDPPMKNNRSLSPENWWKEYYSNRNRIFLIKKYDKKKFTRVCGLVEMIYKILGLSLSAAVKKKYRGYHRIRVKLLLKALTDGLKDNRGKTIDPSEYLKAIQMIHK